LPARDELSQERAHLTQIQSYIQQEIDHTRASIRPTNDYAQAVIQAKQIKDIAQLERSFIHPYFCKVDFIEQSELRSLPREVVYIGRFGLFDKATLTPLVLDWRSPMANLYYDDAFTAVPVHVDGGKTLHFDVAIKRQFELERGAITRYFDSTSAVRADSLLLARLEERGEQKLRDIVETIQAEQNRIIRATALQVLVVQGVAGSGKTTIALHRLSYLAYQNRDRKAFSHFLIIAPNRLFIDYIADVLPDLGVEGVRQSTFADFVLAVLPGRYRLSQKADAAIPALQTLAAKVRTSMACKQLLDNLLERYVKTILPDRDLTLDSAFSMSKETIARKFHEDYRHYPYMTRRKRLIQSLKKWMEDATTARCAQLDQLAERISYRVAEERQASVKERYRHAFEQYCQHIRQADVLVLYRQIITHPKNVAWIIRRLPPAHRMAAVTADAAYRHEETLATTVAALLAQDHKGRSVTEEDLAALLYLHDRLYGLDKAPKFSHIVVDEAQDLAPFQLYALTLFMNQTSMSLFGDLAQTIYPHKGLSTWEEILTETFTGDVELAILHQSYRSTVEIMEVANTVIRHFSYAGKTIAVPVLRHGPEPRATGVTSATDLLVALCAEIATLQAEGFVNIAVIDKSLPASTTLHQKLCAAGCSATLLTDASSHYSGGVSVLPVHQSKGMEFDAVILMNPSADTYQVDNDTDIKLLYVAMTRALHRLTIFHSDPLTPLLTGAPLQTARFTP